MLKSWKASRISDSVEAEMLCSFASLDCRGFFSVEGGGGAGAVGRRLGGYVDVSGEILEVGVEAYHSRDLGIQ